MQHEDDYIENDTNMLYEMRREIKNLEKWQNETKSKKSKAKIYCFLNFLLAEV